MEVFLGIIALVIGVTILNFVLSAGTRTLGAAAKAAVGKGSFSENMELAFKGMEPLDARLSDTTVDGKPSAPRVKQIEVRGLFPVQHNTNVGFVVSVLDSEGDTSKPVLSMFDSFQEPQTIAYQHASELGKCGPDQGFVSWVRVGVVIPDLLQPPRGGTRILTVVLRLIDLDDPPQIYLGFTPSRDGVIWSKTLTFTHTFEDKGYEEAAEHREEARGLALKIGMAVAMADGTLADSEGETLKEWIKREMTAYDEETQASLKKLYNDTMKDAYTDAKNGDLSLSAATERLNEIGEMKSKYDAIELCFDVMAADGVADAEEMKVIRNVAEALELDLEEIERLRDKKIVSLNTSVSQQASVEDLLGIEQSWDVEKIKRHLRQEFQKWNNRLNSLPEGEERDNAQRMLNLISEARKKYG